MKKCEERDGSAGRKPSAICCLMPAVPPFSAHLLSRLSSVFGPAQYRRIESVYCQISGDATHKQNKSKPSLNSNSPFFCVSAPLCKYAGVTQTGIYRNTHVHTGCEKVSLMESEDSNFPSATKDRKPSELNYPCLTHTQTGQHTRTHTHTLIPSLAIIETHTSMHTLSCCDIPENRTIRVTQASCEEYLSKVDFM